MHHNAPKEVNLSMHKKDRSRQVGTFIEKDYPNEQLAIDAELKYIALSKAFRQAQKDGRLPYFPLPNTLKRIGRKVLTTKVSTEGELIYDNHTSDTERTVVLKNPIETKEQALLLMDFARECGVFTSKDTHALLVNSETGIGKAMMLDFDSGSTLITTANMSSFNDLTYQTQKNIISRQIDRFAKNV